MSIKDNLLVNTVIGPLSIGRMGLAVIASLPMIRKLAATNQPWATVLVVEKNAEFSTDAATEFVRVINSNPVYINRKKIAFVIANDVVGAAQAVQLIANISTKIEGAEIKLFDNVDDASKWASDL